MNILGVGPAEIIVVFIIMLAVAGPKRMVQWAYQIGRYTAQLRAMFQETMNAVQKELAASGLDVTKDLPSIPKSFDIVSEAAKVINSEVSSTTSAINSTLSSTTPTTPTAPTPQSPQAPASSAAPSDNSANTGSNPGNSTPSANGAEPKTDDQKPRYDAWTPN
jgi:Sec-independent protein translocase protein TatA